MRVGLTMRVDETPYGELREGIDISWMKLLDSMEFDVVLMSSYSNLSIDLIGELSVDAVILTGGNDVTVEGVSFQRARNNFEMSVLRCSLERKIPVVGVCRGMQIVNLFYGGNVRSVDGHVGKSHMVNFNGTKMMVNSYHNFAIDKLGLDLEVMAQSDDGCIEAIRHKSDRVCGIMWHPERFIENAKWHHRWLYSALRGECA
jgi:putative glutamine amidotransferase